MHYLNKNQLKLFKMLKPGNSGNIIWEIENLNSDFVQI